MLDYSYKKRLNKTDLRNLMLYEGEFYPIYSNSKFTQPFQDFLL